MDSAKKRKRDSTENAEQPDAECANNTTSPAKYIGLNVGGKIYRTSRTTLTRYADSFFAGLLDCGAVSPAKDDKGNYLIDRDGNIFRHVLNFLRCDKLVVPANFDEFLLLRQEADFFMLDALKTAINDELKKRDSNYDSNLTMLTSVGLNVGGTIYRTTKGTLRHYSDSFFSRLLDGVVPSAKDDQGNFMIDRDGEVFKHVLHFISTGELDLPEKFDELELLEQEADFFLLDSLTEAIKDRVEMVGYVINNQVFKLKQKDVMRHMNSLFDDMLEDRVRTTKDTQGNYVIEWDLDTIHYIMHYMTHGAIRKDITDEQLKLLRKDAEDLRLPNLEHHCQSIEFMEENSILGRSVYIHVYHKMNGPCIAYANKSPDYLMTRRSNISLYTFFFSRVEEISVREGTVSVGTVDLRAVKDEGSVSVDDIVSYFTERVVGGTPGIVNRIRLQHDVTLIEVTIRA